jgi:hypothetical protein
MNNFQIIDFDDSILENIGWPKFLNFYIDGKKYEDVFSRKESYKLGHLENGITINTNYDYEIEMSCFILFDEYANNYFHYFTDFFSKLDSFFKIQKIIPNIKILMLEEQFNVSFIRESLELLFGNFNNFIFIPHGKKIKFKKLIVPKPIYFWPNENVPECIYTFTKMLSDKVNEETIKNGVYISRQDTIKKGWWHNRNLQNELNLIDAIKTELNYDIVELMDLSISDKIKIFKSYKNIIQQNGASTVNIFFCNYNTNFHIISHPIIKNWANPLLNEISKHKKLNFYEYDYGKICTDISVISSDSNNIPWEINDISFFIQDVFTNSK